MVCATYGVLNDQVEGPPYVPAYILEYGLWGVVLTIFPIAASVSETKTNIIDNDNV